MMFTKNQTKKNLIILLLLIIYFYSLLNKYSIEESEKWIVMLVNNKPSFSIIKLIQKIKDWKIVSVGNNIYNENQWKHLSLSNNYIYLSIMDQQKLDYKILSFLESNSYSRKNIGYLYAIQQGAKEIYEIDEDIIIKNNKTFDINIDNILQLCYGERNDSLMINPYNNFYLINSKQLLLKPLVYQGLINGIPDLDSIFFNTRAKKNFKIDFNFAKIYPLIYFPGNYIPLNSKNTKYMYDIFPFMSFQLQ